MTKQTVTETRGRLPVLNRPAWTAAARSFPISRRAPPHTVHPLQSRSSPP